MRDILLVIILMQPISNEDDLIQGSMDGIIMGERRGIDRIHGDFPFKL
jgi:hypothetical protein